MSGSATVSMGAMIGTPRALAHSAGISTAPKCSPTTMVGPVRPGGKAAATAASSSGTTRASCAADAVAAQRGALEVAAHVVPESRAREAVEVTAVARGGGGLWRGHVVCRQIGRHALKVGAHQPPPRRLDAVQDTAQPPGDAVERPLGQARQDRRRARTGRAPQAGRATSGAAAGARHARARRASVPTSASELTRPPQRR